jgi:tetratricopeptide (TPR) repeat protein
LENTLPTRVTWRAIRLTLLVTVAGVLGGGRMYWLQSTAPPPVPEVPTEGVERPVARAIEAMMDRVRKDPRSVEAWGRLGKVLRAHSFDNQAGVCFAYLEKRDPKEPRWPYYQGLALLATDKQAAVAYLRRAAELAEQSDPDQTAPRLQLAETLLELGQVEEAEGLFRAVREQDPQNQRAQYNLAVLAYNRNDLEASLTLLLPLSESQFAHRRACSLLAKIYQRRGDKAAALDFGQRARAGHEDDPWPDRYLAECGELDVSSFACFEKLRRMERQGKIEEAIALLQEMEEEGPNDSVFIGLARNLARLKRYDEAEEVLDRFQKDSPRHPEGYHTRGLIAFTKAEQIWDNPAGDKERARELFREAVANNREALKIKPDHVFAQMYLGRSLYYLRQPDEAYRVMRKAVAARPELSGPHLFLGLSLAEDGQYTEAEEHLELAQRFAKPEDTAPARALKRLREMMSRTPK